MGKIKEGLGTLIGNAGEYAVMSELLKRGVIAALAPRNAPAFDILATYGTQTVRIRVKTKSSDTDSWQWVAKKDGAIFRELGETGDFLVLVNLEEENVRNRYFVVPTTLVNMWLQADFENWLQTPGKGGRPHSPENTKRQLSYRAFKDRLEPYEDAWKNLWETPKNPGEEGTNAQAEI